MTTVDGTGAILPFGAIGGIDTEDLTAKTALETEEAGFKADAAEDDKVALELEDGALDELEDLEKEDGAEKTEKKTETAKKAEELKKQIEELEAQIEAAKERKEKAQKELEEKKAELEEKQTAYEKKVQEIEEANEQFAKLTAKIEQAAQDMEDDIKSQTRRATLKAVADYNKDEDGDFEKYLAKQLEGIGTDTGMTGYIRTLSSLSKDLSSDIQSLCKGLTPLANEMKVLELDIANSVDEIKAADEVLALNPAKIEELNAEISALNPLGILSGLVSDAEAALVEEMGVDLYEKLPDGEPRYIFAKGKQDGQYHIYDMAQWNENGDNSLVRLKYGYADPSTSIIPMGNGGIIPGSFSKSGDGETYSGNQSLPTSGDEIFYLESCCEAKTMTACYDTWSPLSLDLNGDGVKTSDRVVEFDIDGDGKKDKINDSADAVLVFDKDGDGLSGEDGSECFGDGTDLDGDGIADGYKNGFEALAAMARKEGLINDADDMKLDEKDLSVLEEKYGLKIKAGGYTDEATSLKDSGITEINLSNADTTLDKNFDGKQNDLMRQEGATFKVNGQTREYADIWHSKKDDTEAEAKETSAVSFDLSDVKTIDTSDIESFEKNFFMAQEENEEALQKAMKTIHKYVN